MGEGINFGNALEAPEEGEWGIKLETRYFDFIQKAGFKTVRLPVRWSAHALTSSPYTIDPVFFQRIDWAIENATRRGLNIVINLHHYDELFKDPTIHRPRFCAIWSQIASRYQNAPSSVLFELCNEPHDIDSSTWNAIVREVLPLVRATNPRRGIILGGTDWNSLKKLSELQLPEEDRSIIGTFHYYSPFHFTHQGAEWVKGSEAWLGTHWLGSGDEKEAIRADLDHAVRWWETNRRPIWIGEFGSYSKADLESRCRWMEFMVRECEWRHLPWAYWEFAAGFGVYDRFQQKWNSPLLRSLFPF
ncbi:MAG: glycoside hydrolase family 5 protein [Verrucomicrobiota bacterium]